MRRKAANTKHVDLRRRQLDSQRHAIESSAYLECNRDISVGEVETVERRHCPFVEQLDRRKAQRFGGCETALFRWNLQRWQAQQPFTFGSQRLPAGCENGDLRRRPQHCLGSRRCGADNVLAIVMTINAHLSRSQATKLLNGSPTPGGLPRTALTALGTSAGSCNDPRPTNQTPSA